MWNCFVHLDQLGLDIIKPGLPHIYMHVLVYHVPMFLLKHGSLKQFTGQGVEKNNDDAKRIFYQKSNKWDGARDVLSHEHRQLALKHHEMKGQKESILNKMMSIGALELWKAERKEFILATHKTPVY